MVDCGKFDKMKQISVKMDKSDTYKVFRGSDISLFIYFLSRLNVEKTQKYFVWRNSWNTKEILNPL